MNSVFYNAFLYKSLPPQLQYDIIFLVPYYLLLCVQILALFGGIYSLLQIANPSMAKCLIQKSLKLKKWLVACSFINNVKYLFTYETKSNYYLYFDGIRSICCLSIIYFHSFTGHIDDNFAEGIQKFYIYCLGQLVDVFFFMSAFLNFMSITNKIQHSLKSKEEITKVLLKIYLNRLLRLYPVFFYFSLYQWKLHRFVVDEIKPNLEINNFLSSLADKNCPLGMFLYSLESVAICSPPSWYLRTELIMFLCLPIICLIAAQTRIICAILILIMISLANQNCLFFCAVQNFRLYNFFSFKVVDEKDQFLGDFNMAFNFQWPSKISCYLYGAFVACCLKIYEENIEKHAKKYIMKYNYVIVYGTFFFGIYHFLDPLKEKQKFQNFNINCFEIITHYNLYSGLHHWERLCFWRLDFLVNLTILLLPAFLKLPNPLEYFLSSKFFQTFGKISYPVYLVHTVTLLYLQLRYPLQIPISRSYLLYRIFTHDIFYIITISFYMSLVVELPFQNILKLLL